MGFRYRKSIRIARGIRINLTGRGISSVSIGKPGATLNLGRRGSCLTVGLPGTGLSYSRTLSSSNMAGPTSHSPIGGLVAFALMFLAGIAIIGGAFTSANKDQSVVRLENSAEIANVSGSTADGNSKLDQSLTSAVHENPSSFENTTAPVGVETGLGNQTVSAAPEAKVPGVINGSRSTDADQIASVGPPSGLGQGCSVLDTLMAGRRFPRA
jgi:hypothetical protein